MTAYFQRELVFSVTEALKEMPVVVITGMRQTGKTTFLQKQPELNSRRFVTFDDFPQLASAKADPDQFTNSTEPITIDEAQKCPEILTAIKKVVDRGRKPGHFLLSGSANFSLLRGIRESLAGRAIYLEMLPFSRREIFSRTAKAPFLKEFFEAPEIPGTSRLQAITPEEVLKGGMPTVCLGEVKNHSLWFKGYEQTYLERDVLAISQIENIIAFRDLLHLAALRTGQLLSPSQLGRDAKLGAATTSRYLSLFETSFLITRLAPYLRNRASRLIKSSKLYISDSGLGCFLAGLERIDSFQEEPLVGAMFETYVAQNLLSLIKSCWTEAQIHFWNIQGRHEVDFIIEANRQCIALEIKSSSRWHERDLSGLKAFLDSTPHCRAAILGHNGSEAVRLGKKMWALPVSIILS